MHLAGDSLKAMELVEEGCEMYPANALVWQALGIIARDVRRKTKGDAADAATAGERRAADALWAMSHSAVEQGLRTWMEGVAVVSHLQMAALHYHAVGDAGGARRALEDAQHAVEALADLATDGTEAGVTEQLAHRVDEIRALLAEPATRDPG